MENGKVAKVKKEKVVKEKVVKVKKETIRKLAFSLFAKESNGGKELEKLTDKETIARINAEIAAKFPESMWNTKAVIHYSYYKSKFIEAFQIVTMA